ncbi:hypothetical protein [Streptomyces cremeus]|uniref:Lipoprotein n=1 Tax=Streptomyces cremeus TaxID=66881 RepID=A0ABV5PII8_STRCM
MGWGRKLAVAVVSGALVTGLAGCEEAREPVREKAEVPVREERRPVERRFPVFGEFVRARWVGVTLSDPRLPGPTDVRMAGVVDLSSRDAERLRTGYEWREATAPSVPEAVTPLLPTGARWRTSESFEGAVTGGGRYAASFHVDFEKRVLVFDALDPVPVDLATPSSEPSNSP